MDKRILQTYAVWAKENLETQIEISLKTLGINGDKEIKQARKEGSITVIEGDANSYPEDLFRKRTAIVRLIEEKGYRNIIEEFAYTWFNRFVALRFMELHDYLSHGFRVLSSTSGGVEPDILRNLNLVKSELHLDMELCGSLKDQGKTEELFRYVLLNQCNELSNILPMLFSYNMDFLELLLPKSLLIGETVVTKLVEIPEENFMNDVEIIGWMYQFYISAKKDAVMAAKKTITKDTLPAVTQLFTPDWIVRYMAENSVGRIWMESYPQSPLRSEMRYYVDDAEQTEEVQQKIDEIKYRNVNPEDIRIIEPCCGSGHILVYVFELLSKMYEEKGYSKRDIPTQILKNNLVGVDVDKRAAQLAAFALVMKARSFNPKFFSDSYYVQPKVFELQNSHILVLLQYRQMLKNLQIFSDDEIRAVADLVDTFKNGKTIGSLIKVPALKYGVIEQVIEKLEHDIVSDVFSIEFIQKGIPQLELLLNQANVLSDKYDVMITNPPYIGISSMEAPVKEYAVKNYPNSKTDMFAMFMETDFVKLNGFTAMINMHSWMFLTSYESLRDDLKNTSITCSMLHLGPRAFDEIAGEVVQTTAFIVRKIPMNKYKGVYCRLVDGNSQKEKELMFLSGAKRYISANNRFDVIPGNTIAYWASDNLLKDFKNGKLLGEIATPKQGVATTDNNRFVRFWSEVEINRIGFGYTNTEEAQKSEMKWFPFNKGGEFNKWYGNRMYVVNYQYDGKEIKENVLRKYTYLKTPDFVVKNASYYFKECISWSKISLNNVCFRYYEDGFVFSDAGMAMFVPKNKMFPLFGLLNSKVVFTVLQTIAPTTNFESGHMEKIPVLDDIFDNTSINEIVQNVIDISQSDWDSFENSWEFKSHPLLLLDGSIEYKDMTSENKTRLVSDIYYMWEEVCQERFNCLKTNEEELNSIFINIYGLQNELTSEVKEKDVTVRLADKERDIKSLISYLIGIIMGRYSLDTPGLAYAGGTWNGAKYKTYHPDGDGIIPIYSKVGMEDGLTNQLCKLIKLIYGEDTYRQNIEFIAEALGRNSNESPEETLNRYLNNGFYPDHLKIYQKRPIYWMFSSGKNSGFKCLIYMHRYNEDTLARINSKYFLPESTRLKNDIEELVGRMNKAEGRDRIRLEKERQKLAAAYNEAIEYGQVLDHVANQYITIDLDDGVKVNYAKFQGVEMVTDSGTKVKKDLLVPIK